MLPDSPLTVKVPGKLMVAGEFAVLEKNQQLVVMAADRFVYATLEESGENRLSLTSFNLHNMAWRFDANAVHIETNDRRVRFVENAMTVVFTYLNEHNIAPGSIHLSIRSELEDAAGRKYGLGSSAAVVTSVVAAILTKFLPNEPSDELIFKLAAISHVTTQGSGSGADVAAASYGGLLQFASFQADWLQGAYSEANNITELVTTDWPYCYVQPIRLPEHVYICIGWTGMPASTHELVQGISALKTASPSLYQQFLADSDKAVSTLLDGVNREDSSAIMDGIRQNRQALAAVGKHANVEIETPLLKTLCDIAESYGGAGKPSGAGGGDCGIALLPSREQAEGLMDAWQKAGIKTLNININETGATVI